LPAFEIHLTIENQKENLMPESKKNRKQDEAAPPSILSSSPGDSPVAVTPKDVSPEHAAWKDLTARPIASDNAEKRTDALLDEAGDLSFPASDPIAVSSITKRPIASDNVEKRTDALLDEASDLSFPASDPIAVSSITKLVKGTDAGLEKADKDRSKNK
jgi:hypothetical protein